MGVGLGPLRYTPDPEDNPDFFRLIEQISTFEKAPTDFPSKCYRIQVDYIPVLLGLLDIYSYSDKFDGSQEDREQSAAYIQDLQVILMTGNMSCGGEDGTMLRQKPSDPCVWQESRDGGATWYDIFDNSLCQISAAAAGNLEISLVLSQAQQQYQQWVDDYDGTVPSVAPGMDYDGGANDDIRDLALCQTLLAFVECVHAVDAGILVDLQRLFWDANRKFIAISRYLVGEAVTVWLDANFPVPFFNLVAQKLLDNIEEASLNFWEQFSPDGEGFSAILQTEIGCYARDNLAGADFDHDDFIAAFAGVSSIDGVSFADEQLLIEFAADTELFVAMLGYMDELYDELLAGDIVLTCGCSAWEYEITDFANVPNKTSTEFVDSHGEFGVGNILVGNDSGPGDSVRVFWRCYMPADFQLTKMKIVYTAYPVSTSDSELVTAVDGQTIIRLKIPADGVDKDVTKQRRAIGDSFFVDFDTGLSNGAVIVDSLTLWGVGDNPFD